MTTLHGAIIFNWCEACMQQVTQAACYAQLIAQEFLSACLRGNQGSLTVALNEKAAKSLSSAKIDWNILFSFLVRLYLFSFRNQKSIRALARNFKCSGGPPAVARACSRPHAE